MPTYVIAEIGTGHGGDIDRAGELIVAARDAGADCAKFQCVFASEIVHPNCGFIDLPGGKTRIYDRFRALERPASFYADLKHLCSEAKIDFLCTVFGGRSARLVESLVPARHKIASPETNHEELLETVNSFGRPVILSTGVTRIGDIEQALDLLDSIETTVLHCVTAYPAREEDYNLRVIPLLHDLLGVPVGVSDHTEHPSLIPGLAVALGATTVEKHFTLDRSGAGLDDPIALDPAMFAELSATVRRIDALREDSQADVQEQVIEEFRARYGDERVAAVLGTGVKHLGADEAAHYRSTRRSLLATRDLTVGHVLQPGDLAALRSESLPPGVDPSHLRDLIGATVRTPVPNGHGIEWRHLLEMKP
jgi:sialic acid synthase SpsE